MLSAGASWRERRRQWVMIPNASRDKELEETMNMPEAMCARYKEGGCADAAMSEVQAHHARGTSTAEAVQDGAVQALPRAPAVHRRLPVRARRGRAAAATPAAELQVGALQQLARLKGSCPVGPLGESFVRSFGPLDPGRRYFHQWSMEHQPIFFAAHCERLQSHTRRARRRVPLAEWPRPDAVPQRSVQHI